MVERDNAPGEGRDWRARAACRDSDPEMFFPVAEAGPELQRAEAAAKAVCAGCPVRTACLTWALELLPHGVAGGMGEAERAELRRADCPAARVRRAPVVLPEPARAGCGGRRPSELREGGIAALADGRDRDQVAAECGVSRRTVDRWSAALREQQTCAVVGGAR